MTVTKRFKEAVTDYHFLANLLHPKFRGKNLSAEAAESAYQLLISLHPKTIGDLYAFTEEAAPFPPSLLSTSCVECLINHMVDIHSELQVQCVAFADQPGTEVTSFAIQLSCY